MSYEDFPWFKEQTVKSIINVEEKLPDHSYWPDIDVDLTEEIIKFLERFPLTAKNIYPILTSFNSVVNLS